MHNASQLSQSCLSNFVTHSSERILLYQHSLLLSFSSSTACSIRGDTNVVVVGHHYYVNINADTRRVWNIVQKTNT